MRILFEENEKERIFIGILTLNKKVRYIHCDTERTPGSTEKLLLSFYNDDEIINKLMKFKHIHLLSKFIEDPEIVKPTENPFNTYDISVEDYFGLDNFLWDSENIGKNIKFLWLPEEKEWYYSLNMGNIHLLSKPNVFYNKEAFIEQKDLEV